MNRFDATVLAVEIGQGKTKAVDSLMPLVYAELRQLANGLMRQERRGHTLQSTALVHEVYLRLVDQSRVDWNGKTHFYRVAAMAMRRLLREHARNRGRKKRGGGLEKLTLDETVLAVSHDIEIQELEDIFHELEEYGERLAPVVEMKVFAGMTHDEIASVLAVSSRTVERDWRFARAKMISLLGED